MKETRMIMGMPITLEIVGASQDAPIFGEVFDYFTHVDEVFSTYKSTSEITAINQGRLPEEQWSDEMREMFRLAEETKKQTEGYFDIKKPDGTLDPSGMVKGWAIHHAAKIIDSYGFAHFYVEAGGDIEVRGLNSEGKKWRVGIRNPFNRKENIKIMHLTDAGIATSGNYERGPHIYDPHTGKEAQAIASITVIGKNAYEADRFATAAFAMGEKGIVFIEQRSNLEGYMIGMNGTATMTKGFQKYTEQ